TLKKMILVTIGHPVARAVEVLAAGATVGAVGLRIRRRVLEPELPKTVVSEPPKAAVRESNDGTYTHKLNCILLNACGAAYNVKPGTNIYAPDTVYSPNVPYTADPQVAAGGEVFINVATVGKCPFGIIAVQVS